MRTRPSLSMVVAAVLCAWAGPAPAQVSLTPAEFVARASMANLFQIETSKLALSRAANPGVKSFAQRMIDDHAMAETELEDAAAGSGGMVATTLDAPHQALLAALQDQTGTGFDKSYVADQIQAHEDAASLLASYKNTGNFAKLKVWAAKTEPVVTAHLKQASALANTGP